MIISLTDSVCSVRALGLQGETVSEPITDMTDGLSPCMSGDNLTSIPCMKPRAVPSELYCDLGQLSPCKGCSNPYLLLL